MSYSATADILNQIPETTLIQLTDDNDQGVVDDGVVSRAIADADAEIDGYCGVDYTVPFDPVPSIIRAVSVDIAIYRLYARRKGAPEDRKTRYGAAVRFLRDVSAGRVSLGASAPAPVNTGNTVSVDSNTRIFTRTKMQEY